MKFLLFNFFIYFISALDAIPVSRNPSMKRVFNVCPLEQPSLAATCGANYTLYMLNLENRAMQQPDLTDPTLCSKFKMDNKEADFIVVGAGIAGSVVAGRLIEEPGWNVVVLEAGDFAPAGSSIPSMYFNYKTDPRVDYCYDLIPQDNACLNTDGICTYPRGKGVGGTGLLHGMMYMRGSPEDYDNLKKNWGIEGWSYQEVLPYFLKSENNLDVGKPDSPIEPEYHSTKGPLTVSYFRDHPAFADDLLQAYKEMGYNINIDLNGRSQNGCSIAQATNRDGARLTTARAYLFPHLNRNNLQIITNAQVLHVIINPITRKAEGVVYEKFGVQNIIKARKEIILSAGTVESPHILMVSGIGPKNHLEENGINVIKDLKGVGQNLRNHVSTEISFNLGKQSNLQLLNNDVENLYFQKRQGPMTSTGLSQLTGFIWTKYANKSQAPDVQIFHNGFMANCSQTGLTAERVSLGSRTFSISPTLVHTSSVGWIKLRNLYPNSRPLIYAGILKNQSDVAALLDSIRTVEKIVTTNAMKKNQVTMNSVPMAGCEHLTAGSDEYWSCYIAHKTNPENHQVGTCRMGATNDAMAVTDNQLRVIGVNNIRVADASVYPEPPTGNLQAPTIMVGERAADFIKKTWLPIR